MNKQPERTAATRNTFIETFIELNQQKPVEKITISELAAKSGYNRSTFYQYFDDTYDLLACIEDDFIQYVKDTIVSQIGMKKTESHFIESFLHIYAEKRTLLKILLSGSNHNNFAAKLQETLIPAFAAQMNLSAGDEKAEFLLDFYLSGIIGVLSRWVLSENPMAPEEYGRLMRQIVEGMGKSELFPVL